MLLLAVFPLPASAAYYDITFSAQGLYNVGRNPADNSESFLQGDPDLYFYMGIFQEYGYYAPFVLQDFYTSSPYSTTNWNFPDKSISLRINTADGIAPHAYVFFGLIDEDLDADDYLGGHWIYVTEDTGPVYQLNNNAAPSFTYNLMTDIELNGWSNNYYLDYSVSVDAVPIPASIWLFSSGLLALAWARRAI